MKKTVDLDGLDRDRAVERLTALWALNEAGLGGLIHALRVPFTGIVVGSTAVVLIALIAFFAERKAKAILKATVIVLLVKAAASPHTPLPAYAAVSFQGLAGALLFGACRRCGWGRCCWAAGLVAGGGAEAAGDDDPLWEVAVGGGGCGRPLDPGAHGRGAGRALADGLVLVLLSGVLHDRRADHRLAGRGDSRRDRAGPEESAAGPAGVVRGAWDRVPAPVPQAWWRRTPFRAGVVLAVLLVVTDVAALRGRKAGCGGLRVFARALVVLAVWMWVVRPLGLALFRRFRRREQGVYGAEVPGRWRISRRCGRRPPRPGGRAKPPVASAAGNNFWCE
jgi:hypothetical protein